MERRARLRDLASRLADPLDSVSGLADLATIDVDLASSDSVGMDPTTSGYTAFPKVGLALGLRVGSASV
jgi:hypothetical protein